MVTSGQSNSQSTNVFVFLMLARNWQHLSWIKPKLRHTDLFIFKHNLSVLQLKQLIFALGITKKNLAAKETQTVAFKS